MSILAHYFVFISIINIIIQKCNLTFRYYCIYECECRWLNQKNQHKLDHFFLTTGLGLQPFELEARTGQTDRQTDGWMDKTRK